MMQRFTAYVVEVNDFGKITEVSHRYGDFDTLMAAIMAECPGLMPPQMPPKGVDGTDQAVVNMRKVELGKILNWLLQNEQVLTERQLSLWKFLNLQIPAVIAGRFVLVNKSRATALKTLTKLGEPKYRQDDAYRLGHASVTDLLMEAIRELRNGDPASSHWCRQVGGRTAVCQLLSLALQTSEVTRQRLLDADVISMLLGVVEREEGSLDEVRVPLNVIVAREAERFGTLLASLLVRGGMAQLAVLAQRPKCQEFVSKLLWLAWDGPVRKPFCQPGGQGLVVLQALLQSSIATCSLLGGVLLAALVAHGEFSASSNRAEALRMATATLSRPEAAADPNFAKTLCGANTTLVRLAGLLEDVDIAPLVLGLLCAAKPPAAKLAQISGNLASLVSDKAATTHSAETRARAAELMLHIQGGAAETGKGPASAPGPATADLERCEGIAEHEASLEKAMKWQLEEALSKTRDGLQRTKISLDDVVSISERRLQSMPDLHFQSFDASLSSFKIARESLEKGTRASQALHHDMSRQLMELQTGKPSTMDESSYKERLVQAEQTYTEVKRRREALAAADADARERRQRAESTASDLKRSTEAVRRFEEELNTIRIQRSEKDSEAMKLRHKAGTPNLMQMKQQAAENVENNLKQAKELQTIGQRVQQGDPDYLRDGESREQKVAELASKLAQLKRQHQELLTRQKEFDFNPDEMNASASRFETESRDLQARADSLSTQKLEAERERTDKAGSSTHENEQARSAEDRRASLQAQLTSQEQSARSQMASLQPLIQEHHSGWQRLLAQQKKLDADQSSLGGKLDEARRGTEMERSTRGQLKLKVRELIHSLQGFDAFLDRVDSAAPSPLPQQQETPFLASQSPMGAAAAPGVFAAGAADPFGDESDPFSDNALAPPPASAPAPQRSAPSLAASGLFGGEETPSGIFGSEETRAPSGGAALFDDGHDDLLPSPPALVQAPPTPTAEYGDLIGEVPTLAQAPVEVVPGAGSALADDFDAFLEESSSAAPPPPAAASAAPEHEGQHHTAGAPAPVPVVTDDDFDF